MFRTAAVLALALVPALAGAGDIRLARPLDGASLHTGTVAMSVYYTRAEGDAVELVATWLAAGAERPHRLRMALTDGDAVSFSLPGHMETAWAFARSGDTVTVSAAPAGPACLPRAAAM